MTAIAALDGANVWASVLYLDRWILYAAMLLASGSALFVLCQRSAPTVVAARIGSTAACLAVLAYVLAIGLEGADLLGTTPFTLPAWVMGARTTLLLSAVTGVVAMMLLLIYFRRLNHRWLGLAAITLAIVSFIVTGHAASTEPRWLMMLATAAHLAAAAFWLGALWPLRAVLADTPLADTAMLILAFSRRAAYAVAVLIASGLVLSWIQLGGIDALFSSAYGLVLSMKVALVGILLSLAWINKTVLTPALQHARGASLTLRRMIVAELVLFALILAAAVALTSVAPPNAA